MLEKVRKNREITTFQNVYLRWRSEIARNSALRSSSYYHRWIQFLRHAPMKNSDFTIYHSIFYTVVGGSTAILELYFVPEITSAFNLMLKYRLIDLVYQQAAYDACDQSGGSLAGWLREMLACDWPKSSYAAQWPWRSISRYASIYAENTSNF